MPRVKKKEREREIERGGRRDGGGRGVCKRRVRVR
jgi:hypothetical protein